MMHNKVEVCILNMLLSKLFFFFFFGDTIYLFMFVCLFVHESLWVLDFFCLYLHAFYVLTENLVRCFMKEGLRVASISRISQ